MLATRARIVLPVRRAAPTERLLLVKPWFLRAEGERAYQRSAALDERHSAPQILTFTSDDFVDAFFAAVAGRAPLPELVPFRDWSEPPAALTDVAGAPRFPASVRRGAPALAVQPYAPGSELDQDGVPRGEPPWLRKLYLGVHRHFQIVVTEAICRRFDAPPVAKSRILGAGMVVRRLVADRRAERWQDWIPAPGGGGLWREIADAAMRGAGGRRVDPEDLAPELFGDTAQRCALLLRLGHGVDCASAPPAAIDELLPAALASHALSPIPAAHGDAARHAAFFGYLPLASSDLQRPEAPAADRARLAGKLEAGARAHLASELFGLELARPEDPIVLDPDAAARFAAVAPDLLRDLETVVRATVHPTGGAAAAPSPELGRALDLALRRAVESWWNDFDDGLGGSAQTWWSSGARRVALDRLKALAAGDQLDGEPLGAAAVAAVAARTDAALESLLTGRMQTASAALWFGTAVSRAFRGPGRRSMLCVVLRRVRAMRRSIAQAIYGATHPPPAESPDLEAARRLPRAGGILVPARTVSSLSGEIDAWLGAGDEQSRWPRPWAAPAIGAELRQVHAACAALEATFEGIDRRGAGAGTAYTDEVAALEDAVDTGVFGQRLCVAGLDVQEQPLRGLFVFPGWLGDTGAAELSEAAFAAAAADFANRVADRYATAPAAVIDTEGDALRKTPQPRYDSNSLYAVQCWLRIRSLDRCEEDHLLWTERSEPFSLAEVTDVLGARPVAFQLPDLGKLVRDIPRIAKANANPFAAVTTPPDSGIATGEEVADTARQWGIAWICSFGIPVFTICAWVLFSFILAILLLIPGFAWLLLLKFCIPVPKPQ